MADELVERAEIADYLDLTERQITTLVKHGRLADGTEFPSRVEGRRRRFYKRRCLQWYIRYKQEEALQRAAGREEPKNLAEAELRKAIADAEIAELRLQKLRGEVVAVDTVRKEWRRLLDRVNARITAAPGEYAPRLMNLDSVPKVVAILREMTNHQRAELIGAGGGGDDDETADVEEEEPAA